MDCRRPVASELDGGRLIESVRWGMVAPYSNEFGGKPTINAWIETVATNGIFKRPFEEHRVVVPALGYDEWKQREDGKQPFLVSLPDRGPLAFAGIAREWHDTFRNSFGRNRRGLDVSRCASRRVREQLASSASHAPLVGRFGVAARPRVPIGGRSRRCRLPGRGAYASGTLARTMSRCVSRRALS